MTQGDGIRVAVLDDYQGVAAGLADWSSLGPEVAVDFLHAPVPREEAASRLAPYAVLCLMRERMPLDAALIAALPALRLVVFTGGRNPSVDTAALQARGITVCNTRNGEGGLATAELTVALMLACARNLPREFANMAGGRWQETLGEGLEGRTLGLVGLGRIGARVASVGRALGMTGDRLEPEPDARTGRGRRRGAGDPRGPVLGERRRQPAHGAGARDPRHRRASRDRPDAPGRDPDQHLARAARRRGGADRGPEGGAHRAGLDVFDREPLPADHPLRSLPNAVLTPHLGYVTDGTFRMFYEDTVEAIEAWRKGAPVRVVTP